MPQAVKSQLPKLNSQCVWELGVGDWELVCFSALPLLLYRARLRHRTLDDFLRAEFRDAFDELRRDRRRIREANRALAADLIGRDLVPELGFELAVEGVERVVLAPCGEVDDD